MSTSSTTTITPQYPHIPLTLTQVSPTHQLEVPLHSPMTTYLDNPIHHDASSTHNPSMMVTFDKKYTQRLFVADELPIDKDEQTSYKHTLNNIFVRRTMDVIYEQFIHSCIKDSQHVEHHTNVTSYLTWFDSILHSELHAANYSPHHPSHNTDIEIIMLMSHLNYHEILMVDNLTIQRYPTQDSLAIVYHPFPQYKSVGFHSCPFIKSRNSIINRTDGNHLDDDGNHLNYRLDDGDDILVIVGNAWGWYWSAWKDDDDYLIQTLRHSPFYVSTTPMWQTYTISFRTLMTTLKQEAHYQHNRWRTFS